MQASDSYHRALLGSFILLMQIYSSIA